jgi:hypothetical protein
MKEVSKGSVTATACWIDVYWLRLATDVLIQAVAVGLHYSSEFDRLTDTLTNSVTMVQEDNTYCSVARVKESYFGGISAMTNIIRASIFTFSFASLIGTFPSRKISLLCKLFSHQVALHNSLLQ